MKKLIIPAIVAVGMVSSVWAMEPTDLEKIAAENSGAGAQELSSVSEVSSGSDVFYVGKDEIKISDAPLFKFSNLIGYKTKDDAESKKNGIKIGFRVKFNDNLGSFYVVCNEQDSKNWWVAEDLLERITSRILNSTDPSSRAVRFENVDKFIKKFDGLSSDLKVAYLKNLRAGTIKLLDDCCSSWEYNEFMSCIQTLDYLINLKEYSTADKVALFSIYKYVSQSIYWSIEEQKRDIKDAEKFKLVKKGLSPSWKKDVCFIGCRQIFLGGGSCLNGDCLNSYNLVGYKTKDDAEQAINGFVIGLVCECHSGMIGVSRGFILPEYADKDLWIRDFYGEAKKADNAINLKLVEDLWAEYEGMDDVKKNEYLDGLYSKVASFSDEMYYLDAVSFEWLEAAVRTLKNPTGKAPKNVYKMILYSAKLKSDELANIYGVQEPRALPEGLDINEVQTLEV